VIGVNLSKSFGRLTFKPSLYDRRLLKVEGAWVRRTRIYHQTRAIVDSKSEFLKNRPDISRYRTPERLRASDDANGNGVTNGPVPVSRPEPKRRIKFPGPAKVQVFNLGRRQNLSRSRYCTRTAIPELFNRRIRNPCACAWRKSPCGSP